MGGGYKRISYWNCGCMDSYNFHEFTQLLFLEGKDYPDKFK